MMCKKYSILLIVLLSYVPSCKLQFASLLPHEGSSKEFRQEFKNVVKECLIQHKADFVQTLALFTLKTGAQNSKCAVLCILQHFHVMDKNGNYNKEKYHIAVNKMQNPNFQAAFRKILNECMREDINDPCERAFQFTDCLTRKSSALPQVNTLI